MSDDNRNEETLSEDDCRVLDLVDDLGVEAGGQTAADDRETLETLGMLAYELDELAPPPEVKQRLMEQVDDLALEGTEPMAAVGQFHTAAAALASETPVASKTPVASARLHALERRARWYMPIAAAFAIALLGVAALQFRQLESQRQTIDELSAQLGRVAQSGVELASIRSLLDRQDSYLRMLTARGAEFCLLKPVGEYPRLPRATATMVISAQRDKWYLAAEGLEPCPSGGCYELWFITDAEPIRGASFDCNGGRVELTGSHESLPVTIRAITITMATEAEAAEPETVLLADQAMTLL